MVDSNGLLLILSGPSGVGKTTVAEKLLEETSFERVVTATTRNQRQGEQDGIDYFFLTREEFQTGISKGDFLEHATVHRNLYGTPKKSVIEGLGEGKLLLLLIDVQGAAILRDSASDLPTTSVFIVPPEPELETLERRLKKRNTESEEVLKVRMENAKEELARRGEYDHEVVNTSVEESVETILKITEEALEAQRSADKFGA